jgi:hypothetical protein
VDGRDSPWQKIQLAYSDYVFFCLDTERAAFYEKLLEGWETVMARLPRSIEVEAVCGGVAPMKQVSTWVSITLGL